MWKGAGARDVLEYRLYHNYKTKWGILKKASAISLGSERCVWKRDHSSGRVSSEEEVSRGNQNNSNEFGFSRDARALEKTTDPRKTRSQAETRIETGGGKSSGSKKMKNLLQGKLPRGKIKGKKKQGRELEKRGVAVDIELLRVDGRKHGNCCIEKKKKQMGSKIRQQGRKLHGH